MAPFVDAGRYTTQIGWSDIPHLTAEAKRDLLRGTPAYLRGARMRGEPVLGEGRIYRLAIEQIQYSPRVLPDHWPRAFAMDVGWNWTAALWGAWDVESDTIYIYNEYYGRTAPPVTHAHAIKARGDWIYGVIDPAAGQRSQRDGERLIDLYRQHGLKLEPANNEREAGIEECLDRMVTGRLKVSPALQNFNFEFAIYRRDEKGKVVKKWDHLMDSCRYLVMSGRNVMTTKRRHDLATGGGWVVGGVADRRAGF